MPRFFNTAGPTIVEDHYHIDPLHRLDWEEVQHLIDRKRYFVLHAPRQTGKTSTLLAIMKALNEEDRYACAYANIEAAQAARGDETQGIPAVCDAIVGSIKLYLDQASLSVWYYQHKQQISPQHLLTGLLERWAQTSAKPTVLLMDEVDALVGYTLISLLRQVRAGYAQRPEAFPQSIILCGVRDTRDYRLHQEGGEVITGGSAFNIKAESLRMGNFSADEVLTSGSSTAPRPANLLPPRFFQSSGRTPTASPGWSTPWATKSPGKTRPPATAPDPSPWPITLRGGNGLFSPGQPISISWPTSCGNPESTGCSPLCSPARMNRRPIWLRLRRTISTMWRILA